MERSFSSSEAMGCSTAETKQLDILSCDTSRCEWQHKRIDLWTPEDTSDWLMSVVHDYGLECEEIHKFSKVDGKSLMNMTEDNFVILEPNCGHTLYSTMQALKQRQGFRMLGGPYENIVEIKTQFLSGNVKENNVPHNVNIPQGPDDPFLSTACRKKLSLSSYQETSEWQQKKIVQWTSADTFNWVINVAQANQLDCGEIHNFSKVDGKKLISMSEADFVKLEPNCGRALYKDKQSLCKQIQPEINRIHRRPLKKRKKAKIGRLWEFIRDLLLNPKYCPSLVRWENHAEGVFKFLDSRKVARLWGEIKDNEQMTYEKFSRAMRYYYKKGVPEFEPVLGQRLVYKFGPGAKGWQTQNPNFIRKES